MDDFDYDNYGMEYGEHNPSGTESSKSDESSAELDNDEETPALATADTYDSHRISELDLERYDFPDQTKYTSTSIIGRDILSAIAVSSDHRRISIHPLGIFEKPAGVSKSFWAGMDADGLSTKVQDFSIKLEDETARIEEEKKILTKRESKAVSGGSGGDKTTDDDQEEHEPSEMPFLDHLEEFRWALLKSVFAIVIAMIASWFFTDIFYATIFRLAKNAGLPLIVTRVMEGIMLKLQMTFVMGLVIALPFIFYFIWSFVSPGLYKNEKRWVLPLVYASTICFFIGASLAYFIIIPFVLPFIKAFIPPGAEPLITVGDFVGKMLRFMLLFGIIFELPMVAYFLAKIGILKHTWMSRYRRYAIVSIFIMGAILTPPDPISQLMMAIPLILLYEVSILVARFAGRNTIL